MSALRLLLIAALLVAGRSAGAAESTDPVTDPAQVAQRYHQVLARPEYQETGSPDTNARMRDWFSQWFAGLGEDFRKLKYAQEMPRLASLLMTLVVALSLVGLIYTLVRLTRRRREWHRLGNAETSPAKMMQRPKFYDEELRRARDAGDWHAAWLASWRQFLCRLENGRLVEADRSRTNREYLTQLRAQDLPKTASTLLPGLVDAYDQFIYGRKPIGEREWTSFQQQVNEAALMLHLRERAPEPAKS